MIFNIIILCNNCNNLEFVFQFLAGFLLSLARTAAKCKLPSISYLTLVWPLAFCHQLGRTNQWFRDYTTFSTTVTSIAASLLQLFQIKNISENASWFAYTPSLGKRFKLPWTKYSVGLQRCKLKSLGQWMILHWCAVSERPGGIWGSEGGGGPVPLHPRPDPPHQDRTVPSLQAGTLVSITLG